MDRMAASLVARVAGASTVAASRARRAASNTASRSLVTELVFIEPE